MTKQHSMTITGTIPTVISSRGESICKESWQVAMSNLSLRGTEFRSNLPASPEQTLQSPDFTLHQQNIACCGRCWSWPECWPRCEDEKGNPLPPECCQAGAGGGGLATPAWAGEIPAGCKPKKCTGLSRSKCREECMKGVAEWCFDPEKVKKRRQFCAAMTAITIITLNPEAIAGTALYCYISNELAPFAYWLSWYFGCKSVCRRLPCP